MQSAGDNGQVHTPRPPSLCFPARAASPLLAALGDPTSLPHLATIASMELDELRDPTVESRSLLLSGAAALPPPR